MTYTLSYTFYILNWLIFIYPNIFLIAFLISSSFGIMAFSSTGDEKGLAISLAASYDRRLELFKCFFTDYGGNLGSAAACHMPLFHNNQAASLIPIMIIVSLSMG